MAREWWTIAGDAYAFVYPDACACCGVTTSDRWDRVPYCRTCRSHVPRFGPWMIALAAAAAGGAAAIGMRRYAAFAPWFVHVAVTALAAVALPVLALVMGKRRRVGPPHVDHEQAVEITRDGLLVRSEAWAAQVAELNDKDMTRTIESPFALLDRFLPLIGAALPIAAVIYWYPQWHVTLWIDNGTQAQVTVTGNGHELASVGADSRTDISIPRGDMRITTSAGDDATIDARVTTGAWVLNVGRVHCYEFQVFGYAESEKALFFGGESRLYDESLFNVEATWFFRPPPDSITVRKDRALPGLAERRSALQIVPCHR